MSARRKRRHAAVLLGLLASGLATADDAELPDTEFLEYLGSWQESDEDWLIFEEAAREAAGDDGKERGNREIAGAPERDEKESTESER
jgi:hypothetical protein